MIQREKIAQILKGVVQSNTTTGLATDLLISFSIMVTVGYSLSFKVKEPPPQNARKCSHKSEDLASLGGEMFIKKTGLEHFYPPKGKTVHF